MLKNSLSKISLLLTLFTAFSTLTVLAENDSDTASASNATDAEISYDVSFEEIVPCQYIYDIWDTTAVDPYKLNVKDSLDSVVLQLVSSDCGFSFPIVGQITSKYGWRKGRPHKGLDLDLVTGDSVACAFDGVVRISEYSPSFGHFIVVRHYNGLETLYAHLSKRMVKVGETVVCSQLLGLGGNTGRSRGSHLHFEVRFLGKSMDPMKIFDFENGKLQQDTLLIEKSLFKYAYSSYSSAGARYYTIRKGDTLGAIARRQRTSVSRLCRLNGIRSTTILRIGRRLRVR
jgi:murein DD-endopeptidase MepM/ murein hydrolase activator NlpD